MKCFKNRLTWFFKAAPFFYLLVFFSCSATDRGVFPIFYQGRLSPQEVYGRLWLYDRYQAYKIVLDERSPQSSPPLSQDPLSFVLSLMVEGHDPFDDTPLFWVGSHTLKDFLHLPLEKNRFSYRELLLASQSIQKKGDSIPKESEADWKRMTGYLQDFETFRSVDSENKLYIQTVQKLQLKGFAPDEMSQALERTFPLWQRIALGSSLFRALPSSRRKGEWFSLKSIGIAVFNPSTSSLEPVKNFTLFSDADFKTVQEAYLAFITAYGEKKTPLALEQKKQELFSALSSAYVPLAGKVSLQAYDKQILNPTVLQLKAEVAYFAFPWVLLLLFLYLSGSVLLLLALTVRFSNCFFWGYGAVVAAAVFHTLLLTARSYILARPPVANMFETLLFVPWIATCASLFFPFFRRNQLALIGASCSSALLLLIIELADLNQGFGRVQPVLDSQFWLSFHVLLVVGSYGFFLLAAFLGHCYLYLTCVRGRGEREQKMLSSTLLKTIYIGTILLIGGTILGGVWAAQSWGRFWDWDPKESWAFISICLYILCIHAYQFGKIASFGLAIGAILCFLAITFTWYGVNYLLGTGLHSYGFGSGGEWAYYSFILFESGLVAFALLSHRRLQAKTKEPS